MVGAAVVGTGFGCITHVAALKEAGIEVLALVGRDARRTAQRAERAGVPHPMTSIHDALALPGVDVVVVATPPATHAALALAAISAGKHVVCEKPFTLDCREATKLQEAAEAAGVVALLGTEFRWGTPHALTARAIADGAIGTPKLATFLLQMPMLAGPEPDVPEWFGDAAQGGGWLGAFAPHLIDQVRFTLGEFDGVSAGLPCITDRGWTVEDTFTARFRTTTGVEGILQSSAVDVGDPIHMTRIVGSEGTLWVDGLTVKVADANGSRELAVPDDLLLPSVATPALDADAGSYERMVSSGTEIAPAIRMYDALLALIEGGPLPQGPPPATFADGVANMVVMDAIRESAADNGRWISIDRL